ncbi:hypothetical protein ACIQHS_12355 [Pseudarthrobacter oxydans]|uniref:hypothetical protein n=1 Tax=Pseudarthrobacter oxydans TaxID=1671 RepID=UPI0038303988
MTGCSGTSIRGEFPARSGNKQLKNALFRSAWIASCHHPASKAYYQKKRDQGRSTTPPSYAWPAPLRRYLLHAQKRHSLRGETRRSRLTESIRTPPVVWDFFMLSWGSAGLDSTTPPVTDPITDGVACG